MIIHVYQTISINLLRVESVTNSSVLQIGSAGSIRAMSQLYNTGGFAGQVPSLPSAGAISQLSLVRLPSPT